MAYFYREQERRRRQRAQRNVRCWVSDGAVERYTLMTELSEHGARIYTAAPPAVGCPVSVRFRVGPQRRTVTADGIVVWRSEGFKGRGDVMGVSFTEVSDAKGIRSSLQG